MKKYTVVTHAGKFHADDVFGVAALSLLFEKRKEEMKLIRTLDPVWIKKADIVLDVGRIYNAKRDRFDHHQAETAGKRPKGILYASFGLIWKKYGKEISGSKKIADIVDQKLVSPLDAADVAISTYKNIIEGIKPVTIEGFIDAEATSILSTHTKSKKELLHKALDIKFSELVLIAKEIIKVFIIKAQNKQLAENKAKKVYNQAKDKRLIIMNEYIGFDFSEFKKPLIVIYPDTRDLWSAQMVKIKGELYKNRIYFPKSWRGKIDEKLAKASGVKDARFCHNSGFLAVAHSKEGAIALAKKAIKIGAKS